MKRMMHVKKHVKICKTIVNNDIIFVVCTIKNLPQPMNHSERFFFQMKKKKHLL